MTDSLLPPGSGPRLVEGFSAIASGIDLLVCDVWGVVHNGVRAHAGACAALQAYRAAGGVVVMLSNAPRPAPSVTAQMHDLGVPQGVFDAVVTSGDLTRALLEERSGQRMIHLGPSRDLGLFEGLDLARAGAEEADLCLCTGFRDDETETVADYAPTLARMAERGLTMICANPDLVVERGSRLVPCAGALAAAYEALGGAVLYAGKPHAPAYDMALAKGREVLGRMPPVDRIAAVGDAIRTDVAGARQQGLRAIFLLDGIHWHEVGAERWREGLAGWLSRQAVQPDIIMERLVW